MTEYEWILVRLMFSVLAVAGIVIYGITEGGNMTILPFAAICAASFFAGRCLGLSLVEWINHHDRNNAD